MAEFEIEFGDDFLDQLLNTDFNEIAKAALSEAVPILEKSMKNEVKKVIQHSGESELVDSLKSGKPKKTKTDAWIVNVTPKGYSDTKVFTAVDSKGRKTHRKYPVSNALKAIWKEYGIPGRQPPKPFLTSAANGAKAAVLQKIQEVYNRKVGAK